MEGTTRPGLDAKDIEILRFYVEKGNRELYFNYLAHKPGSDGYGLLALGVVRNDNAPGATANNFAGHQAARDGALMKEGDWQQFGVDLIGRDLIMRQKYVDGGRPDLALNLPTLNIQDYHDSTLEGRDIKRNGWTPRQLLEAARTHGGEAEAERVWSVLLNNDNLGVDRALETTRLLLTTYNDDGPKMEAYLADMGRARLPAGVEPTPNTDPNRIDYRGHTYQYNSDAVQWRREVEVKITVPLGALPIPVGSFSPGTLPVNDTATIDYLDDARGVRLQRQALRDDFHPDDPNRNRPIMKSPRVLAEVSAPDTLAPAALLAQTNDPSAPGHARHSLYQQCAAGVQRLDTETGKGWDQHSACMSASLTTLAASNGLDRVDHVLLGGQGSGVAAGQNVFVVQGALNDPAHQRAHMPTDQAIATPPEQSFQQLAAVDQERAREQALQTQREQDNPLRSAPAMHA